MKISRGDTVFTDTEIDFLNSVQHLKSSLLIFSKFFPLSPTLRLSSKVNLLKRHNYLFLYYHTFGAGFHTQMILACGFVGGIGVIMGFVDDKR